jgi:hypothetical protein
VPHTHDYHIEYVAGNLFDIGEERGGHEYSGKGLEWTVGIGVLTGNLSNKIDAIFPPVIAKYVRAITVHSQGGILRFANSGECENYEIGAKFCPSPTVLFRICHP